MQHHLCISSDDYDLGTNSGEGEYDYYVLGVKSGNPKNSKCPGFGEVCCHESDVVRKGADFFG